MTRSVQYSDYETSGQMMISGIKMSILGLLLSPIVLGIPILAKGLVTLFSSSQHPTAIEKRVLKNDEKWGDLSDEEVMQLNPKIGLFGKIKRNVRNYGIGMIVISFFWGLFALFGMGEIGLIIGLILGLLIIFYAQFVNAKYDKQAHILKEYLENRDYYY